jgi:hypothetical protein
MIPHGLAKGVWENVFKNLENTKTVSKMGKKSFIPLPPKL